MSFRQFNRLAAKLRPFDPNGVKGLRLKRKIVLQPPFRAIGRKSNCKKSCRARARSFSLEVASARFIPGSRTGSSGREQDGDDLRLDPINAMTNRRPRLVLLAWSMG